MFLVLVLFPIIKVYFLVYVGYAVKIYVLLFALLMSIVYVDSTVKECLICMFVRLYYNIIPEIHMFLRMPENR